MSLFVSGWYLIFRPVMDFFIFFVEVKLNIISYVFTFYILRVLRERHCRGGTERMLREGKVMREAVEGVGEGTRKPD